MNPCLRGIPQAARPTFTMSSGDAGGTDVDENDLRVEVTDGDIRIARRLWLAALDDESVPEDRTRQLHDDLRRLIHAQAQQIAEEFRAAQRAVRRAAAAELRASRRPSDD